MDLGRNGSGGGEIRRRVGVAMVVGGVGDGEEEEEGEKSEKEEGNDGEDKEFRGEEFQRPCEVHD